MWKSNTQNAVFSNNVIYTSWSIKTATILTRTHIFLDGILHFLSRAKRERVRYNSHIWRLDDFIILSYWCSLNRVISCVIIMQRNETCWVLKIKFWSKPAGIQKAFWIFFLFIEFFAHKKNKKMNIDVASSEGFSLTAIVASLRNRPVFMSSWFP